MAAGDQRIALRAQVLLEIHVGEQVAVANEDSGDRRALAFHDGIGRQGGGEGHEPHVGRLPWRQVGLVPRR